MNECVYFRHEVHRATIKDRQRENVQTDIKHTRTWNKSTSLHRVSEKKTSTPS